MNINFPESEVQALERQSLHGDKARKVRDGEVWKWLQEYIYGAIFDEATLTIENAKTEEDRIKAQQMFLACKKPKRQLEFLISQGDAALASLKELAQSENPTLENQEGQNA
jgi:hypothetical protein